MIPDNSQPPIIFFTMAFEFSDGVVYMKLVTEMSGIFRTASERFARKLNGFVSKDPQVMLLYGLSSMVLDQVKLDPACRPCDIAF